MQNGTDARGRAAELGKQERIELLISKGRELIALMEACCPKSQERELAENKLAEALAWADSAIIRNE